MTTEITYKSKRREPNVCMRCGSHDAHVQHHADVLDFRGLTLEVTGLAETVCKSCGLSWTTDGQEQDNLAILREAYSAKRDDVRTRDGLLTGEQIEEILSKLQLSKAEAAAIFGGGPNAFAKYIKGDVLQSFPMDRLLRVALAFGLHATRFLREGCDPSLTLYAAGFMPNLWSIAPTDVKATTVKTTSDSTTNVVYM
jgi:HTH-type transcriptional regulator/antitoxin MqsA